MTRGAGQFELRRRLATGFAAALALAGAASCDRAADGSAPAARQTTIRLWHPWPRAEAAALKVVVAEFERTHPNVRIELSYAANDLTNSQKLFLAIAGGVAPDVTFVDGQQLAEWAARGALADLTDAAAAAGVRGDQFFAPRWAESTFAGRVYALPWTAEPNFALVWNKRMFREAGLDPERPPRTIDELDACNAKLTRFRRDADGRVTGIDQVGLVPWAWANNSVFTWGYAFGGDFYVPPWPGEAVGHVTANDPKVVESLRWMQRVARDVDPRQVAAFNANFVGAANDPFYLERTAMTLMHVAQLPYLRKYAPSVEYGVGYLPAPPGGEYASGWIGGWSLAIPRGHAVTPEAFEFIRWLTATREGAAFCSDRTQQLTAFRDNPYFASLATDDPDRRVFYEILQHSRHTRTLMPVQGYLMGLIQRALEEILYGGRDPQAVMDDVTAKAQARLEHVMRVANAVPSGGAR